MKTPCTCPLQLKSDEGRVTKGSLTLHHTRPLSGAIERGGHLKQLKRLVESRSIEGYKNQQSRCYLLLQDEHCMETSQQELGRLQGVQAMQVPRGHLAAAHGASSLDSDTSGSRSLSCLDVLGAAQEEVKFSPEIWKWKKSSHVFTRMGSVQECDSPDPLRPLSF